jgi:hypothetical protein
MLALGSKVGMMLHFPDFSCNVTSTNGSQVKVYKAATT